MHLSKITQNSNLAIDKYSNEYYNKGKQVLERVKTMIGGTFIIVHNRVLVNTKQRKERKFVNMSKFSDFGLSVRMQLLQIGKDQKWLASEVTEKTGLYVDGGYMYKILTGKRNAPKVVEAIKEILQI